MKPLYFTACAHPRIAPALAVQAHESLRPYTVYLKSALTAARKRESRSVCRWEPVPREWRLTPKDSLLVVEAEGCHYRLEDWSADVPVPDMPLFVGDQYRPMSPRRVERIPGGLLLVLDGEVGPGERVFWAGRSCTLTPTEPTWPARLVARRRNGTEAHLFQRRESAVSVILVVEGREPLVLEDEHGTELPHRVAEPHEGATHLNADGMMIPWTGQRTLALEAPPDQQFLLADNGVRWAWSDEEDRGRRRRGVWIQLLPPDEVDSEAVLDVRTAYMEEGVREVRIEGRGSGPPIRVLGFQRDSYRLELERRPPEGSTLFIPSSISGLQRQRQAVFRFKDRPLPHHRALLRLCEAPDKVRWPECRRKPVSRWHLLDDEHSSGTVQQREFVEKALGTPDFAFLEGPPGSGKTHAICELVLQCVDLGWNVLLCSTTHVAVDNVLERLIGEFEQVEAVRIGLADRVDRAVRAVQIDERISALTESWRNAGTFADLDGDAALEQVAEATILSSVNLTCGTSTGILAHPYIRRSDDGRRDDPGPGWPWFDVLIIDEASKTTFQEFLVPAQLARKWIVVGDVRQLPPFSEPRDLEASIAEVSDEDGATLSGARQAALLILFRLRRPEAGAGRVRWLIEEPGDVLDALMEEVETRSERGDHTPEIVRVVHDRPASKGVSILDVEAGRPEALRLLAADWILFPSDLRSRIAPWLPPDGLALRDWDPDSPRAYRFAHWLARRGRFKDKPVREQRRRFHHADELAARQRSFLHEESWAGQVSWRLGRVHQLADARSDKQRERRQREVDDLMPAVAPWSEWTPPAIDAIRDVGVRSVIESFRVSRSNHRVRRPSALTEALPPDVWRERAVLIEHQHRMHPDISRLPREQFYEGDALKDANTLEGRDERVGWSFAPEAPARRVWVDVRGREERGVNREEIAAMRRWLEAWRDYAGAHRRTDGQDWTVACLSFYHRQELGTRDMLRELTGMRRAETRFSLPNTAVACATVDRFQGREADLVLLSLRNTSRPGHMDSPNRLNVGITRARFLLVVFGHRAYFAQGCPSEELNALAEATPLLDLGSAR